MKFSENSEMAKAWKCIGNLLYCDRNEVEIVQTEKTDNLKISLESLKQYWKDLYHEDYYTKNFVTRSKLYELIDDDKERSGNKTYHITKRGIKVAKKFFKKEYTKNNDQIYIKLD